MLTLFCVVCVCNNTVCELFYFKFVTYLLVVGIPFPQICGFHQAGSGLVGRITSKTSAWLFAASWFDVKTDTIFHVTSFIVDQRGWDDLDFLFVELFIIYSCFFFFTNKLVFLRLENEMFFFYCSLTNQFPQHDQIYK